MFHIRWKYDKSVYKSVEDSESDAIYYQFHRIFFNNLNYLRQKDGESPKNVQKQSTDWH